MINLEQYTVGVVLTSCLIFGYVIKTALDFIPNKYIPLIMLIVGIVVNIALNNGAFNFDIILQGAVSGLASTGTHQLITRTTETKENKTQAIK